MSDDAEYLEAQITLTGDAETIMNIIEEDRPSAILKEVKLSALVKYQHEFRYMSYGLPVIKEGDAVMAQSVLELLNKQRAIAPVQYDVVLRAIEKAKRATL